MLKYPEEKVETAVRFLSATKFSLERSLILFKNYQVTSV